MEKAPQARNLLEEPMTTVWAMAEVEGPGWMEKQEAMEKGVVSDGEWDIGLQNALERLQKGKSAIVYGKGGLNRWYIEPDGSISFSESHAESGQHLQKARDLGFIIVP